MRFLLKLLGLAFTLFTTTIAIVSIPKETILFGFEIGSYIYTGLVIFVLLAIVLIVLHKREINREYIIAEAMHQYIDKMRNYYSEIDKYNFENEQEVQVLSQKVTKFSCEHLCSTLNKLLKSKSRFSVQIKLFLTPKDKIEERLTTIYVSTKDKKRLKIVKKEDTEKNVYHYVSENTPFLKLMEKENAPNVYVNPSIGLYATMFRLREKIPLLSSIVDSFAGFRDRKRELKGIFHSTYPKKDMYLRFYNALIVVPIRIDTKKVEEDNNDHYRKFIHSNLSGFLICDRKSTFGLLGSSMRGELKVYTEITKTFADNLNNFYEKVLDKRKKDFNKIKNEEIL